MSVVSVKRQKRTGVIVLNKIPKIFVLTFTGFTLFVFFAINTPHFHRYRSCSCSRSINGFPWVPLQVFTGWWALDDDTHNLDVVFSGKLLVGDKGAEVCLCFFLLNFLKSKDFGIRKTIFTHTEIIFVQCETWPKRKTDGITRLTIITTVLLCIILL